MKLSKGMKKILYVVLGLVLVIGIALFFFPIYQSPIKDPALVKKLEYSGESVLIITPRFTETAYSKNGFYDYYDGSCGEQCLTVPMQDGRADRRGSYNLHLVQFFKFLGYPMESDDSVHLKLLKSPDYLKQYKSLIVLHSEYATKELFQAITSHPHVIYLSPNALYAEINYTKKLIPQVTNDGWGTVHVGTIPIETITLIRGHNYPEKETRNGFGWKYDNSNEEYDLGCKLWKFRDIPNGKQLNCVAEVAFPIKPQIILKVKELIE